MISFKKQYMKGVTLFETLLVLAIMASIIIFSFSQYQSYRLDVNIQTVKYNVDTIFEALAAYHKANCYGSIDPAFANQVPNGQIIPGALNPNNPKLKNLTDSVSVDISVDLAQKGFWPLSIVQTTSSSSSGSSGSSSSTPTPPTTQAPLLALDPLVDSTGPGYQGYIAQFNPYTSNRVVCITPVSSTTPVTNPTDKKQCSETGIAGTIILWKAQVAVLLGDSRIATDPTLAQSYLNLLGGDCLSSYDSSTNTVTPCSQITSGGTSGGGGTGGGGTTTTANYVVWERLPSLAAPKTQSGYWASNVLVQQFTQMYTTYPMLYLLSPNSNGNIPNGTSQYLYCGG